MCISTWVIYSRRTSAIVVVMSLVAAGVREAERGGSEINKTQFCLETLYFFGGFSSLFSWCCWGDIDCYK